MTAHTRLRCRYVSLPPIERDSTMFHDSKHSPHCDQATPTNQHPASEAVEPEVCHLHATNAWRNAEHLSNELIALVKSLALCERQGHWNIWGRRDLEEALRRATWIEATLRNQVELAPLYVRNGERVRSSAAVSSKEGGLR